MSLLDRLLYQHIHVYRTIDLNYNGLFLVLCVPVAALASIAHLKRRLVLNASTRVENDSSRNLLH